MSDQLLRLTSDGEEYLALTYSQIDSVGMQDKAVRVHLRSGVLHNLNCATYSETRKMYRIIVDSLEGWHIEQAERSAKRHSSG